MVYIHIYTGIILSIYDGTSVWSDESPSPTDSIFAINIPTSILINSNLTPVVGVATISPRYYDDNNEVSLILGLNNGIITSATDANASGKGTVNGIANSNVDNFIFRTNSFSNDIINLRVNEIPQLQISDIKLEVFGGLQ